MTKVFVLDTNVISDITNPEPNSNVLLHMNINQSSVLCLCQPVDYEIRRGYLKKGATRRLSVYNRQIKKQFRWIQLNDRDWLHAAQLWADAVSKGIQLSDVDLLIAAIAMRLDAVIVTADNDFDALPVKCVNWREPLSGDN